MAEDCIFGTCLEMCPETEITQRERNRQLSIFEMMPGTECQKQPKANKSSCVKQYVRSAAGRDTTEPSLLRPAEILLKTVKFLTTDVLSEERHGYSWLEIYNFVSDRIRCVRQDMVIQRISGNSCIEILEISVRFHIIAMHRLQSEDFNNFDPKLNRDILCSYLSDLLLFYTESPQSKNVDEFYSYHILLNLSTHQVLHKFLSSRESLSCSGTLGLTLQICFAYLLGNHVKVFRLFGNLPYVESCCLISFYNPLRLQTLKVLNIAFSSKAQKFPVSVLKDWLKFDSEEQALKFCLAVGLSVENNMIGFERKVNLALKWTDILCFTFHKLVDQKCKQSSQEFVSS